MPSTILEIAKSCGVAKQTVTKYLREMGLWDEHVTRGGRAYVVDDQAAALVSDAISRSVPRRGHGRASESAIESLEAEHERRVADLRAQIDDLRSQLHAKDAQISSLTALLEASRASESAANERVARMASAGLIERLRGFRGLLGPGGGTS